MPSVLFVCMANRFRSPLAAALFRRQLEARGMAELWQVSSAGTWAETGLPALGQAREAALQYGLDLSGHRSRRVDRQLLAGQDLVLVMQASQQEALLTEFPEFRESIQMLSKAAEARTYDIPDPSGYGEGVTDTAAELEDLIRCGMEPICEMAASLHSLRLG
jgi:protein-tyrosine phosphatase